MCVVGLGGSGLTAVSELLARGARVVGLEAGGVAGGAAGRNGEMPAGAAIAAVSTAGYFGFLVGPSAIGFVAELTGLGTALYIVVGLSATVALMAGTLGRAPRGESPEEAPEASVEPDRVETGVRVS